MHIFFLVAPVQAATYQFYDVAEHGLSATFTVDGANSITSWDFDNPDIIGEQINSGATLQYDIAHDVFYLMDFAVEFDDDDPTDNDWNCYPSSCFASGPDGFFLLQSQPYGNPQTLYEWHDCGASGEFCDPNSDPSANRLLGFAGYTITAAVPIPAAVWLFGSGLIGLIGIARRKKA